MALNTRRLLRSHQVTVDYMTGCSQPDFAGL